MPPPPSASGTSASAISCPRGTGSMSTLGSPTATTSAPFSRTAIRTVPAISRHPWETPSVPVLFSRLDSWTWGDLVARSLCSIQYCKMENIFVDLNHYRNDLLTVCFTLYLFSYYKPLHAPCPLCRMRRLWNSRPC